MLLEELRVTLKVAEFRSITAAATHLDVRTATASAALKRVESANVISLMPEFKPAPTELWLTRVGKLLSSLL